MMITMNKRMRGGFTLIELMAAMAILVIITLFVGRIFSDSSKMWKLGTRRVTQSLDGRAVIDFMVREMSSAIADGTLVLAHHMNATNVLGMDSDFIYFVTADQQARAAYGDTYREVKMVSYHIKPMQGATNNAMANRFCIVRDGRNRFNSNDFQAYTNKNWWQLSFMTGSGTFSGDHVVLAENVRTMEFWMYDQNGNLVDAPQYTTQGGKTLYLSNVQGTPGYIEIYIELLGEDDAIKAALLTGQEAIDFADRASRRYVGRVYLNNGRGYAPDA